MPTPARRWPALHPLAPGRGSAAALTRSTRAAHYLRVCCFGVGLALASACGGSEEPASSPADEQARLVTASGLFERGKQLAEAGDSVRAEQYIASAVRKGYPMEQALPLLIQVCLSGSRLRSALNYALPYIEQHPEAVDLRFLVATVYLSLSQPLEARDQLLQLLSQEPEHKNAHYLLGVTEWEGFANQAAARAHFQRYLELDPHGRHAQASRTWLLRYPEATPALAPSPSAAGNGDVANSEQGVPGVVGARSGVGAGPNVSSSRSNEVAQ